VNQTTAPFTSTGGVRRRVATPSSTPSLSLRGGAPILTIWRERSMQSIAFMGFDMLSGLSEALSR
jgi:hypothetical protein